jgi:hypothetical protein
MTEYRLVNLLTGDETTGTTSARRFAFEEIAGHIMLVLMPHHRVQLFRTPTGIDVYLILSYPKGKKAKERTKTKYRKLYEATITDVTP